MDILYIPINSYKKGFKRKVLYRLRNFFHFQNPGVFFEAGLRSAFDVSEKQIDEVINNYKEINNDFDAIVVNSRLYLDKFNSFKEALIEVVRNINIPKILFIRVDKNYEIFDDEVLDKYDVVFKQEPFKDLSRYKISENNRQKIHPAVVNSTIHKILRNKFGRLVYNQDKFIKNLPKQYKYDVFFLGRINRQSSIREDAWRRVVKEDFNSFGGVQIRDGESIKDKKLLVPKINFKKYVQIMKASKINLALDGIGFFTPRHLDIWKLGCFMLASPKIREIRLPFDIKEGLHYVAFDNLDDMVEKIKYYLTHDEERERIAKAGKELFEKEYNVERHGEYIKKIIKEKINEKNFNSNK